MTRYLHISVFHLKDGGFRVVGIRRGPTFVPIGPIHENRELAVRLAETVDRKNPAIGFYDLRESKK